MSSNRSRLRIVEAVCAIPVLIVAVMTVEIVPGIDTLETILGVVPGSEALGSGTVFVFPTLLAIVTLVGAVLDWPSIASVVVTALAVVTLVMVALSVDTLVFGEGGGVFFGHLFVGVGAIPLAALVLVRPLVERLLPADRPNLLNRFGS